MVEHWAFELVVSLNILLSAVNAIYFLYYSTSLVVLFDDFFIWLFCVEILVRMAAMGPEVYLSDRWNAADALLVFAGIAMFFVQDIDADGLIRILRLFRVSSLFRALGTIFVLKHLKFEIYGKLRNIFTTLLMIMPIIVKFLPLFAFFFYFYAIIGL